MQTIEGIFNRGLKYSEPFLLRQHEPGDMGWITHRHGVLYAREYGYDARFEALVAQITADFITNFRQGRERCWIAEMNGEIIGSIFCVQASETVAKLRLLLVEPSARGLGLGARLVQECINFATRAGYETLTLWTQSELVEARHLYAKHGFTLVRSEPAPSFGKALVSEVWELPLHLDRSETMDRRDTPNV
jgi:GNAT superfamily N-acetyltransferase